MLHPQENTTQGKLTITGNYRCIKDNRGYSAWHYEVVCICGKRYFISRVNWLRGVSSCLLCRPKKIKIQLLYKTRIYNIWAGMLSRCRTPTNKAYKFYGGKGVKVCAEWQQIKNFHAWAISNGYADTLTIDRIDPSGNYEPTNCRWLPFSDNKRRKSCVLTYPHGETFASALDAAKHFHCHDQYIRFLCRTNGTYKNRWFYYE